MGSADTPPADVETIIEGDVTLHRYPDGSVVLDDGHYVSSIWLEAPQWRSLCGIFRRLEDTAQT